MSAKFEIQAEKRDGEGTGASRRLRRTGKVPAILYGGGKDPMMVAFDHDLLLHHLESEVFHTSILTVKVAGEQDQAILRDVHMHPFKRQVMHIDLQRISATEKLHIAVPLHFIGEEVAPGVKLQGGIVAHLMTEVDITCLPHQLPEYFTVDLSNLNLNDSIHLSDIPLPEGVTITSLAHGSDDLAVAAISAVRVVEEEAPAVAEAVEGEPEAEPVEAEKAVEAEAKKEDK